MPIKVQCSCGKRLSAPDRLAGKTVKCPGCGSPLKVPGAGGTERKIRVQCGCGKVFAAPMRLAGKTVKCPGCGLPLDVVKPVEVSTSDGAGSMASIEPSDGREEFDLGQRVCPNCGAKSMEGTIVCVHCGTNMDTGERFGAAEAEEAPKSSGPPMAVVGAIAALVVAFAIGAAIYLFTKKKPRSPAPTQSAPATDTQSSKPSGGAAGPKPASSTAAGAKSATPAAAKARPAGREIIAPTPLGQALQTTRIAAELQGKGYLGTVVTLKSMSQRRIDTIQVDKWIKLFEAEHGRRPKSLDELQEGGYKPLPKLPPGYTYAYDSKSGKVSAVKEPR